MPALRTQNDTIRRFFFHLNRAQVSLHKAGGPKWVPDATRRELEAIETRVGRLLSVMVAHVKSGEAAR